MLFKIFKCISGKRKIFANICAQLEICWLIFWLTQKFCSSFATAARRLFVRRGMRKEILS